MFGRRDREHYIGGYDPEWEMPDPDREAGGRWQSDAWRAHARDSRWAYRWNPERAEREWGPRHAPRDEDRFGGAWDEEPRERIRGHRAGPPTDREMRRGEPPWEPPWSPEEEHWRRREPDPYENDPYRGRERDESSPDPRRDREGYGLYEPYGAYGRAEYEPWPRERWDGPSRWESERRGWDRGWDREPNPWTPRGRRRG